MTLEYIAGFVDGEGTIAYFEDRARIAIPQTHELVLEMIAAYLGVGKVYSITKRKEHWKDAWIYVLQNSEEVLAVLKLLLPYLIVKRDNAIEVINTLEKVLSERAEKSKKREATKEEVLKLLGQGLTTRQIEKVLPISRTTVSRIAKNSL